MGFRDAELERSYQTCRSGALRRHDQQLLKYAFAMNAAFNIITLSAQKGVGAALLYCATLLAHTAALRWMKPGRYGACRDLLMSCWRLSWHTSCILGLAVWSGPYNDSLSCFIKLLTFVSGVVALNWLHVFTVVSPAGLNLFVQAVSAGMYMWLYTPQHVCHQVLLHPSHVAYMERLWRLLDSIAHHTAQMLLLPIDLSRSSNTACSSNSSSSSTTAAAAAAAVDLPAFPYSSSSSSSEGAWQPSQHTAEFMCLQTVWFLQITLGLLLPCFMAAWSDFAARRMFLCERRQQQQQQQQQEQCLDAAAAGSSSCSCSKAGCSTSAAAADASASACAKGAAGKAAAKETATAAAAAAAQPCSPPAAAAAAAAAAPGSVQLQCGDLLLELHPGQLMDHPIEWVFNGPCLAVYTLLLYVGLWLLLCEMVPLMVVGPK